MKPREPELSRYSFQERLVHWAVALTFLYLLLTGLALFSPHLFWLAWLLGGGTTVAWWHPVVGVVFFGALFWMFRLWRHDMKFDGADREWMSHLGEYIRNQDRGLPEVGRFNPGQKQLFWLQAVAGTLLLLSGIPLWFPHLFPQGLRLVSVLVHELAALAAIGGLLVHVYMGLAVVRGSLSAMITGKVSAAWARAHHARWYRRLLAEKGGDQG